MAFDASRFHALVTGELTYVWNTLRRLGVHAADLEDVAQDVLLRVYRKLGDYDASRPLRPWIFGFSYRAAADYRKLARHRREVPAAAEHAVDPAPAADDALALQERRKLMLRALDALPLERRAVFVLHELEERTLAEIATTLDIPANTAGSRLRIARTEFSAAARRLIALNKEAS